MNFLNFIERKRDGHELSADEVAELVKHFTADAIPDYQMAAFLMAVNCRGMSMAETRALTLAMRDSGTVLEFPKDDRPIVDKHSTGGVGDKVSLVLAPLLVLAQPLLRPQPLLQHGSNALFLCDPAPPVG